MKAVLRSADPGKDRANAEWLFFVNIGGGRRIFSRPIRAYAEVLAQSLRSMSQL
jgi:hypothetical protein